ncbi:MAG TPA: pseudouridine synthase [Leucothrix sp.]|nr:pseudouridine synthase [Leucothrix sp.]
MRQGVSASRVWLPKNIEKKWDTILDFLVERFAFISQDILEDRLLRGDIVNETGTPFNKTTPYQGEIFLFYYREIPNEPKIPFKEKTLFKDENIIVVDKPHFIPVTPTGRYVKESLLARLKHHYQNEEISPIHRLDRETAGIVLFSCNRKIRGAYQTLFQKRQVNKVYEAIAATSELDFPVTHKSRIVKSDPFFIMKEGEGEINSETIIQVIETEGNLSKYLLKPITGKQHQLRVHMMSLGIPILNDPFYPVLLPCKGEDYSRPLQLLAKSIEFTDPISGQLLNFQSLQNLKFGLRN